MLSYLLRRLLYTVVTFMAIVTAVFFLVRAAPGGPFDGERRLTPEIEANLMAAYDLDAPVHVQFGRYVAKLARGDLGPSFRQKDFSVNELIGLGLPVSMTLGFATLLVALGLGITLGVCAAMNQGQHLDRLLMSIGNFGLAVPIIVSAPVAVLLFAVLLPFFPAGGADTPRHFVLPVITLAVPLAAQVARLVRGGVVETLGEAFITTARAKGVGMPRVLVRHVLPIALIPLVSFMAPAAAALLTGSVVVEQVFDMPGIGRYFVEGALNRDYTLVMGVTIVYAFAILLFNFLADMTYGLLDPRMRLHRSA